MLIESARDNPRGRKGHEVLSMYDHRKNDRIFCRQRVSGASCPRTGAEQPHPETLQTRWWHHHPSLGAGPTQIVRKTPQNGVLEGHSFVGIGETGRVVVGEHRRISTAHECSGSSAP